MEYILCLILFALGLYAVLVKRDIIKIIIGIGLLGYASNIMFLLAGHVRGGSAPITHGAAAGSVFVDPLAQAIVLITVLLGLAITILLAALGIRLYEKYGTLDISEIRKLKG